MTILNLKKTGGYTLIEMLISITIFSGLLIIVLGVVATSSSSSAKVSVLREKSQAARALIDQISNDLRYVDNGVEFKDGNDTYKGFVLAETSKNRLVLALHLPNADPNFPLVRKEYIIQTFNNHLTLTLLENRKCKVKPDLIWDCDTGLQSLTTDLLSTAYSLNNETNNFPSEFSGLLVTAAETAKVSPYVSIDLTIKPIDLTSNCSDADSGTCYKVSTKINMGGSR